MSNWKNSLPPKVDFSSEGLSILAIGEVVHHHTHPYILEIDRTSFAGHLEYRRAEVGYADAKACEFMKIDLSRFTERNELIKEIFFGKSLNNNTVRQIVVELNEHNPLLVVDLMDSLFARGDVSVETSINKCHFTSYTWDSKDFEIYYAGMSGTLIFFIPVRTSYWS